MIQSICIAIAILSPLVCCWCLWIGRRGGYEEGYSDGTLQAVRLAYMKLAYVKSNNPETAGMDRYMKINALQELIADMNGGDTQHDESTTNPQGTTERPDLRPAEQAEAR